MGRPGIQIFDHEFGAQVEYFEELIGRDRAREILKHGKTQVVPSFWYRYIKTYQHWKQNGSKTDDVTSNSILLQFGMIIRHVQLFESDWDTVHTREPFLQRFLDNHSVEGLLFELRTGVHFLRNGLDTHWVGVSRESKMPDVEIRSAGNIRVAVECTHRKPRIARSLWSRQLANDLLNAAARKRDSSTGWLTPRVVCVSVPEEIDWTENELLSVIEKRINGWIRDGKLLNVNALVFVGKENIVPMRNERGHVIMFIPDQRVLVFRNPLATYPLPDDVNSLLSKRT